MHRSRHINVTLSLFSFSLFVSVFCWRGPSWLLLLSSPFPRGIPFYRFFLSFRSYVLCPSLTLVSPARSFLLPFVFSDFLTSFPFVFFSSPTISTILKTGIFVLHQLWDPSFCDAITSKPKPKLSLCYSAVTPCNIASPSPSLSRPSTTYPKKDQHPTAGEPPLFGPTPDARQTSAASLILFF